MKRLTRRIQTIVGRSSAYQKAPLDTWQTEILPAGFLERGFHAITAYASLRVFHARPIYLTLYMSLLLVLAFGGVLICGVAATPTTPSMPLYGEGFYKGARNNPGGGGGGERIWMKFPLHPMH